MKRKMQTDGKPETAGRSLTGNDGLGRSRGRQETRPPPSLCFGQKKVSWNEQKRDRHQGRLSEILLKKGKKKSRLVSNWSLTSCQQKNY